jgi:predicted nucleic acid-binding Zn ribbon protein
MVARKTRQLAQPVRQDCARCGLEFSGQRNRRFCSANCKRVAWDKAKRAEWRASQGRPLHSNWGRTAGVCVVCGAAFVGHKDKRYCSVRCGQRARRPQRREYERKRASAYRLRNRATLSARRKNEQSRAKARAYAQLYRIAHRDKLIAYQREWRLRNIQKLRESNRRRYALTRALRLESTRRWTQQHPAVHAHNEAARRARKRSADGSHTLKEWLQLLERSAYRCFYCGLRSGHLTRDHDVPLVRGGSDRIGNIRPACARCNSRKGRSTAAEFQARLTFEAGGRIAS